jgi:Domain of unknown function (DUF4191)
MARSNAPAPVVPKGRIAQLRAVFTMTRRADKALIWWMLATFVGATALVMAVGLLTGAPWWLTLLPALAIGFLLALIVMARRAEKAAFNQIAGQPGAAGAALNNLRRGWTVETEPVAVDPRTQDLVFRAVGRPGVLLVTEGPLPRVGKLAEAERKRVQRVLPGVPVTVMHAGDGQVPLPKISGKAMRMKPTLSKQQAAEVTKRLRALGGLKPPVPKGIDPMRARPDRKGMRGR